LIILRELLHIIKAYIKTDWVIKYSKICGLTKCAEHTHTHTQKVEFLNGLMVGLGRMKIQYRLYVVDPYLKG
jgi:hypothetical protein